jgi:histidine triad (HIT) family protein
VVILDRFPSGKGHVLILPKRHATDMFELNEDEASGIIPLAKKLAEKIKIALNCAGINIVQNNGKAAGQEVFHYHTHIVPRYENDGLKIGAKPTEPTLAELEVIYAKLKKLL